MSVRSGFLFLPMTINGDTRWLRFARWRVVFALTFGSGTPHFRPVEWLDGGDHGQG